MAAALAAPPPGPRGPTCFPQVAGVIRESGATLDTYPPSVPEVAPMPAKRDLHERFWEKVDKGAPLGCWQWRGGKSPWGYGRFVMMRGKRGFPYSAHRVAWEMLRGPIPDDLCLDHLCRNRACVNPDHLEPVTNAENILRGIAPSGINKRKTHCIHGHALTEDNVYRPPSRPHTRQCRKCAANRDGERQVRRRDSGLPSPTRPYKSVASEGYVLPAERTHCSYGHEFTEENTYHPPKRPHTRQCRECRARRDSEAQARRMQVAGSMR
jgi:hypothetical protein